MAVYFIYQLSAGEPLLKIGRAKDIYRRRNALQTGNPHTLVLVGWIQSDADGLLEAELHRKHHARRVAGEWFRLEPTEILEDLMRAGSDGFVARHADAFEIIGHDRDAVPEYLGVWEWGDLELDECCPLCGAMCGMHFQEASQAYHCISCGRLSERTPVPLAGCGETDHRGMADGLQHRASAQRYWRDGTRRVYEPPPPGAYGHRS